MAEALPAVALSDEESDECSVCVAVHVRPLIDSELLEGCEALLNTTPQQPQVVTGAHSFTYDHVFGVDSTPPEQLYGHCVEPLVSGLFKGYNATVFAYGQTGSGKTYTMGSAFTPGGNTQGVIPKVMDSIFQRITSSKDAEYTVRVGFVEIHKEDIKDLLVVNGSQQSVHIREVLGGGVCLAGATEKEVPSKAEMAALLEQGTLLRATATTGMNKRSSRSHAIFTITVEQRRQLPAAQARQTAESEEDNDENEANSQGSGDEEEVVDDYLCAKMHLVDLAGSERVKRTKAEGQRLQEGININKGLLALGNVICALSENKPHVPYRDSKLTRMLQDSLGGNSRTCMIACVSPADINYEETLNTLRYANRARNIRNKPVVNRDPNAAQISQLRQQLSAARAEIGSLKRRLTGKDDGQLQWDSTQPPGSDSIMALALDELQQHNSVLDLQNAGLRVELDAVRQELVDTGEQLITAQAQRDRNAMKLEQLAQQPGSTTGDGEDEEQGLTVLTGHLSRIAALEKEVRRLKQVNRASGAFMMSQRRQSMSMQIPGSPLPPVLSASGRLASGVLDTFSSLASDENRDVGVEVELAEDEEFAAEEHAHRVEQQRFQSEMDKLQHALEAKEAQMQRVVNGTGQVSALKQHYDRVLMDLAGERDMLQADRTRLLQKLQSLRQSSDQDRSKLEKRFKERLKEMDVKMKDLHRKEKQFCQLERLKARSEETCARLNGDILAIKQQKVSLMRQMEKSTRDFADWRKEREKEVMQLRRQGRKTAAQVQRLEALHAKQQAVLRRKTEEAEAARKRLHEMIEVHRGREDSKAKAQSTAKANSLVECQPNTGAPLLRDEKARRDWVERELDICCQSFDLQRVLEGEKALRSEATRQLKEVEKKLVSLRSPAVALSSPMPAPPGSERNLEADKALLQDQIKAHSAQILLTQQQLMKAKSDEENKGGGAADARRWNGLRNVVESRALLKTAFRTASTLKAQVYETQTELTEAREELELMKLKLEVADQEAQAAKRQAAEATAATAALLQAHDSPGLLSPENRRSLSREDIDVETLMQEIKQWGPQDQDQAPHVQDQAPQVQDQAPQKDATMNESESQSPSRLSLDRTDQPSSSSVQMDTPDHSQNEEEEEASSSSDKSEVESMADAVMGEEADGDETEEVDEEDGLKGDTVWEPDHATPWRHRRSRRNTSQLTARQPSRTLLERDSARAQSEEPGPSSAALEGPVLMAINVERTQQGLDTAHKLTVQLLKAHLKGKVIGGQEWKAGNKKREDLMYDYRDYMGISKTSSSVTDRTNSATVPSITLPGLASPQPKEDVPSTPRSSPWRENPAFLPPGTSKPGTDPSATSQAAAPLQRSAVSADLSDRLASMSVVGNGFQRVREASGEATDSSISGQGDEGSSPGGGRMFVTGRANALGRLKDRQQQLPRKTADEDGVSKGTPAAKYYLQVPVKQ
ncbi:TPA: hypothetical protein ACH3X1_002180 [Trebouxia sp. C0004]